MSVVPLTYIIFFYNFKTRKFLISLKKKVRDVKRVSFVLLTSLKKRGNEEESEISFLGIFKAVMVNLFESRFRNKTSVF